MRLMQVFVFGLWFLTLPILAAELPRTWEGTWVGQVRVGVTEVPMQMTIAPIDEEGWHWRIKYGGEQERRYQLHLVDPQRGHYVVDEQNGILIDHIYRDGVLTASFTVNGKLILYQYEMTEAGISIHAPMFRALDPRRSGSEHVPVCSFVLLDTQRGLLKNKSNI